MKHEFLENLNNCNEGTSFLCNENEFPSYPVPVGRRLKHLGQPVHEVRYKIYFRMVLSSLLIEHRNTEIVFNETETMLKLSLIRPMIKL